MSGEIWVAIITSVFSFAGTIVAVVFGYKKNAAMSKEQTDLTLYRIGELEKKQEKYNHLQERVAFRELHDAKYDENVREICSDIKMIKKKLFKE
jgi:hypothetical protein